MAIPHVGVDRAGFARGRSICLAMRNAGQRKSSNSHRCAVANAGAFAARGLGTGTPFNGSQGEPRQLDGEIS